MSLQKSAITRILYLLIFILIGINASAQNSEKNVSDSLRIRPVTLSEIPIRSAETLVRTKNILKNLMSADEISTLKHLNDSILNRVEEENSDFFENIIQSKNTRFLANRKLQLKNQILIVESEKNKYSELLSDLAQTIKYLNDEKKIWSKTRKVISDAGFSETMMLRLDLISNTMDSASINVSSQAEDILSILDRSSEISIEMGIILGNLERSIRELEEQHLQNDYPSIFSLDYHSENFKAAQVLKPILNTELKEFNTYVSKQTKGLIFTFILFVTLLYLFIRKKRFFTSYQNNSSSYYQNKLGFIFTNPVNTALLIVLFSTVAIFPNRPPAFRDITFLMLVIPIILLMRSLLDRKLLIFIYSFSILFVSNMIFLILPPENVIFRYYVLLIAATETILLWLFSFHTLRKLPFAKPLISALQLIGYVFFIMAIIGFLSSISGNIVLSIKLVSAVSFLTLAFAVIYCTVIIVNGLFVSLLESKIARKVNFINNHGDLLKEKTVQIINSVAVLYLTHLLLVKLTFWNTLKDVLLEFLARERIVGEIQFSIGSILIFFVVIYISTLLSRIIQIILEGDILDRLPLKKGKSHTVSMMVRYSLVCFGLLLAISATGMQLSSMTVIIGAFGVGIGFGLQNIFNNIVSGLILLFDRPVKIGDTIEVGTLIGKVNHIGIRTSNVKTFDGAEVIVPNGQLISNEVINWTLSDQQKRIEVQIGVSYKSDPHQVHEILMEILNQHKDVLIYPLPQVLFSKLGESSLDFRLLFWTESIGEWLRIQSEVTFKAFDKLKENGIEIPFPQRELHLKSSDE